MQYLSFNKKGLLCKMCIDMITFPIYSKWLYIGTTLLTRAIDGLITGESFDILSQRIMLSKFVI